MNHLLEGLRGQLIVSCQAAAGSPFRDPAFIRAFARAAVMGGAAGLRLESLEDLRAVRAREGVPIIGLVKRPGLEIYITPEVEDALAVRATGADIVAFDATLRKRAVTVAELVGAIWSGGGLALADIATVADAVAALEAGADAVSTTLSGYTPDSPSLEGPDLALVRDLAREGIHPFAEGRYRTPDEARAALDLGAHAVVVGSAITRPEVVTGWFARAVAGAVSGL